MQINHHATAASFGLWMMDGSSSSDQALLPLLELGHSSSNNRSTLHIVTSKILSHPDIICGYDQLKAILVAANVDDAALLNTLDLFSYGVYSDYVRQQDQQHQQQQSNDNQDGNEMSYLPLNEAQIAKLRQLTFLSLVHEACQRGQSAISYDTIAQALHFNTSTTTMGNDDDNNNLQQDQEQEQHNRRSMEQLLIGTLYAGIVQGKLCQKSRQFLLLGHVPPCKSRDVPFPHVSNLLHSLRELEHRLITAHETLEGTRMQVSYGLEQSQKYWKSVQERQNKALAQATSNPSAGGGGGGSVPGVAGIPGGVSRGGWPPGGVGVGDGNNYAPPGSSSSRRSSASRQSKRKMGPGGSLEPFQRY